MLRVEKTLDIKSKNSLKIIGLLVGAGAAARFVGGMVRDSLLLIPTSDIDIATNFTPWQVTQTLESHKIKTIPTGIKFGTVTAILGGEAFEITTLRKDLSCDGRHAIIEYSNDFYEDAARRDFTINALSYCPLEQVIYDYFNGIEDLSRGRVVFIGNADERLREDYLRILRFFRFSCKYSKILDDEGFDACIRHKDSLTSLSYERIKQEMDKLLVLPNSPYILDKMYQSGILQTILPVKYYDHELYLRLIEISRLFGEPLAVELVYAILLGSSPKELLGLRFSKASATRIAKLIQFKNSLNMESLAIVLKTIRLEEKSFLDYFILAAAFIENNKFIFDLYNELKDKEIPAFPVRGNELEKLGFQGKKLGNMLKILRTQWIESNFALGNEQLINLVKKCDI